MNDIPYGRSVNVSDVPMYSDRQLRDAVARAREEGAAAERERFRAAAEEHEECCDVKWIYSLLGQP